MARLVERISVSFDQKRTNPMRSNSWDKGELSEKEFIDFLTAGFFSPLDRHRRDDRRDVVGAGEDYHRRRAQADYVARGNSRATVDQGDRG